jgi:hypothetical protein
MKTFGVAELVTSIMKKNFSYEIKDSEREDRQKLLDIK